MPYFETQQSRRSILKSGAKLGAGVGAVVLVGCGGPEKPNSDKVYVPLSGDTKPKTGDIPLSFETYNEQSIKSIAGAAADRYKKAFGVSVDRQVVIDSVSLQQSLIAVSPERAMELCGGNCPIDALTISNIDGKREIQVYREKLDKYASFLAGINSDQNYIKQGMDAYLLNVMTHEIIHFETQYAQISERLSATARRNVGKGDPIILESSVTAIGSIGFKIGFENKERGLSRFILAGLEEAAVEEINNQIPSNNTQRFPTIYAYQNERMLFRDLIAKTFPNRSYPESIKQIVEWRLKEGGLEEFMTIVGQRFDKNPETQLDTGFNILSGVSTGDPRNYTPYINGR